MAHNGHYLRRLHNMIRAKTRGAGFRHHAFRDGRAQVLANAQQRVAIKRAFAQRVGKLLPRRRSGRKCRQGPEQSAIAEAGVRGRVDRVEKPLDFTFDERRGFAFGPRKSLSLDLSACALLAREFEVVF
jgi:hypothetical protein